jgi:nucleobase:cation symporter-1, NCS1 family
VRKLRVTDDDLFAGERSDGTTLSRLGDWNAAGWWAMGLGLGTFWLLHYWLTDIAAVTTASFPAIFVSGASYLLLTLAAGYGEKSRLA